MDKDVELGTNGISIHCDSPISRSWNSAHIRIEVREQWDLAKYLVGVQLKTGGHVQLQVRLYDKHNLMVAECKKFSMNGAHGRDYASALFNDLSKGIRVYRVEIQSSETLHCRRVEWVDYNPE